jgi:sec-independent protein translocase protein TatA
MLFLALPGPYQLWIVVLLVLLLFGAKKLPDLARAMGSSIGQFKRGLKDGGADDDPDAPKGRDAARLDSPRGSAGERDRA